MRENFRHLLVFPTQPPDNLPVDLPTTPKKIVKNMAFKSPLKTRQLAKCNNCKLLKQNLRDVREKQLKIQRDRMIAIRNLRMKQKDKRAKKTLNQKIKRKNEQIERHKSKLSEFSSAKKTVSSITKKHTQLKKYYKESKKSLKFEMMAQKDKEAEERIVNRERKLAEREKEIVQLQRNQLLLEEKVEEMECVESYKVRREIIQFRNEDDGF